MNTNKSFSAETSERYALALFELAKDNSEIDIITNNIDQLLEIYYSNKDFEFFVKNPTYSIDDQLLGVNKISEKLKFSKTFGNFLSVLVIKRRIFFLEKIIKNYKAICSKDKGETSAVLTSSKKLTSDELQNISNEISKFLGSKINFKYKLDENLIGGLKMQIGSLMIDASIKNKIKKYKQMMLEE